MSTREWLLSASFLCFVALKLVEVLAPLESWPLSNVAMFSRRMPREIAPQRLHIHALRGGRWAELTPGDLSLSEDELARRLRDSKNPRMTCGEIVAANKARLGVTAAMLMVESVPRPGSDTPTRWSSTMCPLGDS